MTHRIRIRYFSGIFAVVLSVAMIPAMLFSTTSASATTPSLPSLTAIPLGVGTHYNPLTGVTGYPYDFVPQTPLAPGGPSFNLTALGYVENEYLMSGTANIYSQSGFWSSNGNWSVAVSQANVPYTTRVLVRYPTNPASFNGTVVVEWSNVITGGDQDPVWSEIDNELLSNGYAYELVTCQSAGMTELKNWDPVRYGTLGDSNDSQSYDIFTQAAEVARANTDGILGSLNVQRVIGVGDSQSAFRVDTYVNAIQPISHAFNAFMAIGRSALSAPISGSAIFGTTFPALIRTNNTAPFIQLNAQGDILELDAAAARQSDNTDLRTWELAGAAHIDVHEATYELQDLAVEQPTTAIPQCILGTPVEGTGTELDGINQTNNMPIFEAEDAAIQDLQNWLVHGVAAPHESSTLSATPLFFGLFYLPNTNQYGISSGGLQMPDAQVPTEFYGQINFSTIDTSTLSVSGIMTELEDIFTTLESGAFPASDASLRASGLCLLSGYFTNLGSSTLKSLYPTLSSYVSKFTTAAQKLVQEGFMTQADATAAEAEAAAGYGPPQQPLEAIP
jgi:hypothetical protein